MFPAGENDFFRNRLTHSLEVSKIARTIASKLNHEIDAFKDEKIDLDLIEFASMAHDLGHPPFGHIGERALNRLMKDFGGFEGNAQTFRILSRLEKRETSAEDTGDCRRGLNLTARSLAATIKKHHIVRKNSKVVAAGKVDKGIYEDDEPAYNFVLENVYGDGEPVEIVIESSIMDIADDISYATYDFEDIIKSGFFSPIDMVSLHPDKLKLVCEKVTKGLREWYPKTDEFTENDYAEVVGNILSNQFFDLPEEVLQALSNATDSNQTFRAALALAGYLNTVSSTVSKKTVSRTELTSLLVEQFVDNVDWQPSESGSIKTSRIKMPLEVLKVVETLKHLAFVLIVKSPNVSISEQKGTFIVESLWKALFEGEFGADLMPEDIRDVVGGAKGDYHRARAVCDYIAGMTDQYALNLHSRIIGAANTSVHVPV